MRKRILGILLCCAMLAVLLPAAVMAAEEHVHVWDPNWTRSETHHWHTCTYPYCELNETEMKDYGLHVHVSRDCTEDAYCDECGMYMSDGNASHNWSAWSSNGDGTHTRQCQNRGCAVRETANCSGGTATCLTPAVCEYCGGRYGQKDPNNHACTAKWITNEQTHRRVWSCGVEISPEEAHSFNGGIVCMTCGYIRDTSHTHCICGGNVAAGDHTAHSDVTYQAWDGTSAITYMNNVAHVYLTGNVTISENLEITGGKTLYLCLNGKSYHSDGTSKITVRENSHFILCDCAGGGNIKGAKSGWGGGSVCLYKSRMDFFSGCFIAHLAQHKMGGGAIALDDAGCVLNVYGGSFQNILSTNGGAVYMSAGTMNVYGGSFERNWATHSGGAIYMNNGTLNVYGGSFSQNGRNLSGGLGTNYGGAIYVSSGTLNLRGGTFNRNGAMNDGGAIYMNGGTLNVSGSPVIESNQSCNYVGGYQREYLDNIRLNTGITLNIDAPIAAGTRIGISSMDSAYPVVFSSACAVNYADRFVSDREELRIAYNSAGKLQLYEPTKYTVTVTSGGHGSASANLDVATSETVITLSATPDAGYHFKEWQVVSGNAAVTGNSFIMPEGNVEIRAVFEATEYSVTVAGDGNGLAYANPGIAVAGTEITLSATPAPGYHFKEWQTVSGNVTIENDKFIMPIGNVEIRAIFEATEYSVTVVSDGNGLADASHDVAVAGTEITLSAVPAPGYHFKGWQVVSGGATVTGSSFIMPIGDVEIRAIFEAHIYTGENARGEYLKTPATCTEEGIYYRSCAVCGESSVGTEYESTFRYGLDPDNHTDGCTPVWVVAALTHEQKYSLCGRVILPATAHTYGDWTVTVEPTSGWEGEKEHTCTACGHTETAVVPAYGESYSFCVIQASAGANGAVSPAGSVSVTAGAAQLFTFVPDAGYEIADVKIDGKSVGAADFYLFENVTRSHTIEVSFRKSSPFTDVPKGSYYEEAVNWARENGITSGMDETHFNPNGVCTRAQAVTFLWRAAGCPVAASDDMPFTDVERGSYYYDAVLWALENGITSGMDETRFNPDGVCTRAQIVTFLWRAAKCPAAAFLNPFTDVKPDAYYADAVLWALENGITAGISDAAFSPDADCTRAQIVTFLWRAFAE